MPKAGCYWFLLLRLDDGDTLNALAIELAAWIRGQMENEIIALPAGSRECRAVFRGPPDEVLQQVLAELSRSQPALTARTSDGLEVQYPAVLQVDQLVAGIPEARPDRSGQMLFHGLAGLRNDPSVGIFLTLVPPGAQASDTHESTRKTFGVGSVANEGGAPISAWWQDAFIQHLVDGGLGDDEEAQLDQAKRLLFEAVVAADAANQHEVCRRGPWEVLSRLYALKGSGLDLDSRVCLATGFPPSVDHRIDSERKLRIHRALVEKFERVNIGAGTGHLREQAARVGVRQSDIDDFASHIRKCDVVTSLSRSMSYYYAPENVARPPVWWKKLTVQVWDLLLEDDSAQATLEIGIECINPLAFQVKGIVPVVLGAAQIRVQLPDGCEGRVQVTREAPGGAANRRQWLLSTEGGVMEFTDDSIPEHKTPIRYVAELLDSGAAKKESMKLVSLRSWEPGVIVCSRTAIKGKLPRLVAGKYIEATLEMSGTGRHYLDLYVRPGFEIASETASVFGEDEELLPTPVRRVADGEYGIEVEAGAECHYEVQIRQPGLKKTGLLRIGLVAEEGDTEQCGTYFEYYLARNARREGSKLPRAVQVNSHSRSAQLQGWALTTGVIDRSYYPFVVAPDYASQWRRRDWASPEDVIFSAGRFLSDPRPGMDEMRPPLDFLEARRAIASRIVGADGADLIESTDLGQLMASDKEFEALVERYIKSYLNWLTASPEVACWCDLGLVMELERDGESLEQVPNAILVSPLHPVRFAWQCLAQRTLFYSSRKLPCPAASILDPDCVPDTIALPLRDATGSVDEVVYFSVECSSDYWGVLWNTRRLDRLGLIGGASPLDREMGLLVGGISSGFSVSQVHRAIDDVCEMLVAKPVIGVLVSSSSGQNNACNEGILSWGRDRYSPDDTRGRNPRVFGASEIHIFDERAEVARPGDAEVSNLAEDTGNAVQWYAGVGQAGSHDLAIIAQLETSNQGVQQTKQTSPLGFGGLVRSRIREQQLASNGRFLSESRVARVPSPVGDGLADNLASAIAALEGLSDSPVGYLFAPSIGVVKRSLEKAEFAAVSSSAVDPACFLGSWLEDTYLWDYELPSYSGRSGDSNGYYLLSQIKELDIEVMKIVLQRLPGGGDLSDESLKEIVQEVARRGIPTVRGLSTGNSGAAGDLGLFIATRLLQDCFRTSGSRRGLLTPWKEVDGEHQITLVVPVDPFQRYLDDLAKAIKKPALHRPDLLVVAIFIRSSEVRCRLTPIEVKNRSGSSPMSAKERLAALEQAQSLSSLLLSMEEAYSESADMLMWRLAHGNLVSTIVEYGFRVYSQQLKEMGKSAAWAELHARVMQEIHSSSIVLQVDHGGRLIVIDGCSESRACDTDGDSFSETVEICQRDAALIVCGDASGLYDGIKAKIGTWGLMPADGERPTIGVGLDISPAPIEPCAPQLAAVVEESTSSVAAESSSHIERAIREGDPPSGELSVQTGLILRVGEVLDSFQPRTRHLNLGDTALNQLNMGVVGDLGTGKTQLLQSLIYQIASGRDGNRDVTPNVLIFDYKRDYSSPEFLRATGARVIRPQRIPLNIFDLTGAPQSVAPWLDRYRFFSDALEKVYSGIGAVQRERLKAAIKLAYSVRADGDYPTIYDVHANYQAALNGGADSVTGILGDMVDMELFADGSGEISSLRDFLSGVVVIALDELGQDDRTKNMLVAIMLNLFYENMLKIPKRPFVGVDPKLRVVDSMLLVDEADNIMKYEFDVLRKLLLQGREFGVGVILASQYLSHFKAGGTDYREPLLTWFLHKVPNLKIQELSALGLSEQSGLQSMSERIKALNVHECMYKTYDAGGDFIVGAPFYRRGEWL